MYHLFDDVCVWLVKHAFDKHFETEGNKPINDFIRWCNRDHRDNSQILNHNTFNWTTESNSQTTVVLNIYC